MLSSAPEDVKTPIWEKIQTQEGILIESEDDFRIEIQKSIANNQKLTYDFFAADGIDEEGAIAWEKVGQHTGEVSDPGKIVPKPKRIE